MTKKILLFFVCFLFLFCGCHHTARPETENTTASIKTQKITESSSENTEEDSTSSAEERPPESSSVTSSHPKKPLKQNGKKPNSITSAVSSDLENAKVTTTKSTQSKPKEEISLSPVPTTNRPLNPNKQITVYLKIDCSRAIAGGLYNKKPQLQGVLPTDGVLFEGYVPAKEGESAMKVIQRTLKKQKIASNISGGYIVGIAGIAQLDCGDESGWLYKVNGFLPGCSADAYPVLDGNKIEVLYSCKMGDVF